MPSELRWSQGAWLPAAVGLVTVLVFSPVLATGFNADDFLILWRIKEIEAAAEPLGYFKFAFYEYFRPIGFLSFALDWRIWGPEPFGFHLTSLLLHVANALLVLRFASQVLPPAGAAASAALFALHPASHEAVYWTAARFDLLATFFFLLSLDWLTRANGRRPLLGGLAFALALLSKESAVALLLIVPAWHIFVARLPWPKVLRHLLPMAAVAVLYAALRVVAADLDAAGGRVPKLVMMGAGLVALLAAAWWRNREDRSTGGGPPPALFALPAALVVAASGIMAFLALTPRTTVWAAEKIGFLSHVVFYGLSPIVFPAPPANWFAPDRPARSLATLALVAGIVSLCAWVLRRWHADRDRSLFLALFAAAALLPVSSMTGGLRYLYLPGVAIALLLGAILDGLARRRRIAAGIALGLMLGVSTQQLLYAGRAWRAASQMTDDGLTLMAASISGCDDDDILLLTTPVGIGGVYANFFWEALALRATCPPRSLLSLLRVERSDVHVEVFEEAPGVVVMRVAEYRGNIMAASDLRNFRIGVLHGDELSMETPVGRLESSPDGSAQIFRLTMNETAKAAHRFYYSAGRMRQ